MSQEYKPLILVDGSSYLYRAFHALPALTNSKGFPTGAIYGVINMLKRLMADFKPTTMAVVFDAKGKTFRDAVYSEYKATRKAMPDELVQQIEPIHAIIAAMGLPIIMVDGVEADDVIGTLTARGTAEKKHILVSTGDKDLAQLVNPYVTLINTMSHSILNPANVREKFGVDPDRIIDYLTLVGDTSDNIPGVPLVGPKTAAKLLQQYGSLDNLIANADKLTGKAGENFRQSIPQFAMVKSLVTIKLDLDLPVTFQDLEIKPNNSIALITHFKELEFKTWLSEQLENTKPDVAEVQKNYSIILSEVEFVKCLERLQQSKIISMDIETTHFNYMDAKLVGVSFALSTGEAFYIPFGHNPALGVTQLDQEEVLSCLKNIYENSSIQKICLNAKFHIEVLRTHNIKLAGFVHDPMMESYVLDSSSNSHDLDTLALKYLGRRTTTYIELAGKGAKQVSIDQIDIQKAGMYAAEAADVAFQLHTQLWEKISNIKGLKHIYETIEIPLVTVLAEVECNGVLIDPEKLNRQTIELKKRLVELETESFQIAGKKFNLGSPKQLQEILFDVLQLPILQKTPTGQPSTADNVLQELALDYTLPSLIIEHRSLSKLISTYTTKLVEQMHPSTGRVHTSYNQTVAATGRLSSSDPNLQNIPIRTAEGRKIRQAFIAAPGNKIISADYSQIELRIMAHISQDKSLLTAFAEDRDIHQVTAAEVWEVPLDQVTSEMRRNAKAINFGLIYGMSAFGLTRQLGIDRKSAQEYINRYFARYPSVQAYMDSARLNAKQFGYVETLWGRRLYIPDINASKIPRQKAAERAAINAPLQGSAADIIKMAMINIANWLREEKIPAKMIMQVHDELVFEAKEEICTQIIEDIRHYMSQVVKLSVPLSVSIGVGDNWDAASAH